MWPHPFISQAPQDEMIRLTENNTLQLQVNHLNGQVHTPNGQINILQVENARLRALLQPPPPPASHIYTSHNDNVLHLPEVMESLALLRDHFELQGTLKQCSHPRCCQYAFEQICFREGHVAWCRTHNRIITGNYTSCSVKAEDRGDCMPVWWQPRDDWTEIAYRAYREGRIGHKGIQPGVLNELLFPPVRNPRQHGNWQ